MTFSSKHPQLTQDTAISGKLTSPFENQDSTSVVNTHANLITIEGIKIFDTDILSIDKGKLLQVSILYSSLAKYSHKLNLICQQK
jgi:hypothetical protein